MTALVAIKTAPRARYLAWLPAVLLVAWGILSAAGVPLTPNSLAASTGTTTVSATVAKEVHIPASARAAAQGPSTIRGWRRAGA